jgi:hypothetical protein
MPKNPKTAAQTTQRQQFTTATKAGAGLTAAAQPSWRTFAKTPRNNLSSFNAFVNLNVTSQIVGATVPRSSRWRR